MSGGPETPAAAAGPPPDGEPAVPAASRRAIELVSAYGVAQWNVVQAHMLGGMDEQFREAKARQVAAYHALMEYIAALEQRRPR